MSVRRAAAERGSPLSVSLDRRHDGRGQKPELSTHPDSVMRRKSQRRTQDGEKPLEDLYGTSRNARVGTGMATGHSRQPHQRDQAGASWILKGDKSRAEVVAYKREMCPNMGIIEAL